MARAQLIHIQVDRRLGHEWDEGNGRPLPGGGDFSAPPGLFFRYAAVTIVAATALVALLLYLVGPRLATLWQPLPRLLWIALGVVAGLKVVYLALVTASYYGRRNLLPEGLLERGLYLKLMNYTSLLARVVGKRDWVEHAHVLARSRRGQARLGRACRHRHLQRIGGAAWPPRRQGRAARADSALPVERSAGRRARDRGSL